VLQDVAMRIDLAFKSFFRRVKNKKASDAVGYPRFKGYGRYDSITYKQYGIGIKIISNKNKGEISLSKIGHIKTIFHRKLEGIPKTVVILKSATNKWYVSFSCEIEQQEALPKSDLNIGIDVGLETFAYMSNDTKIDNPRFFRKEEVALAKANRKLAKFPKPSKDHPSSKERIKVKKTLCRVHERIKFKRENFAYQEARKIINKYQIIAIEDLNINRMIHNHCLAKSISDASWSLFFNILNFKAEEAGRSVIKVNPAYTSQDCSQCGHREKKSLATRIHKCNCCGLTINRDLNASINILRIGLDSLGIKSLEAND
jgi:putative transposase